MLYLTHIFLTLPKERGAKPALHSVMGFHPAAAAHIGPSLGLGIRKEFETKRLLGAHWVPRSPLGHFIDVI